MLLPSLFFLLLAFDWAESGHRCGRSEFDPWEKHPKNGINELVYNGHKLHNASALPWMVSLELYNEEAKPYGTCTGTIVSEQYILTAGHCVEKNPATVIVSYGATNATQQIHSPLGQYANNSLEIKMHPKYLNYYFCLKTAKASNCNPRELFAYNDLAIIKLPHPLNFSSNVQPVCLGYFAPENEGEFLHRIHHRHIVAGWGMIDDVCIRGSEGPKDRDILHFGRQRSMKHTECVRTIREQFKRHELYEQGLINDEVLESYVNHVLCAKPHHGSAEPGDSGGPLLSRINDHWFQLGITSQGFGFCQHRESTWGMIDTYSRIDCDWIVDATEGAVQCHEIEYDR